MATVDFWDPAFLDGHIRHTMAFYDKTSFDPDGGFYHYFKDDGTVYDRKTRHLVSSTRFAFNNAMAFLRSGDAIYQERTRHALDFMENVHKDQARGGYAWELRIGPKRAVKILDDTKHCYGLAFVMLAQACGLKAGIASCREGIAATWELLEKHFWLPGSKAYASQADGDWNVNTYRGQNDNMHACEALLMAWEATDDAKYLKRASLLADTFTRRLAGRCNGQIWEHYAVSWIPDLNYNKDDRSDIFRPWGIQTGHQTEWAKLLLILDRHQSEAWHVTRARDLFDTAMKNGWDAVNGGLRYGYDLEGAPYDDDKYHWVQAESLAAAALLFFKTKDPSYREWYERIWAYSWKYFVDHKHGAWYRILAPDNSKMTDEKSPAGKADYHTMGACHEILRGLESAP